MVAQSAQALRALGPRGTETMPVVNRLEYADMAPFFVAGDRP